MQANEIKTKAKKRLTRRAAALIAVASFVLFVALAFFGLWLGFRIVHAKIDVWLPNYAAADEDELKAVYFKEVLTESDYRYLLEQTGLTKVGIDRARAHESGWERVRQIHADYFKKPEVVYGVTAPFVCADLIDFTVTNIYLETGDILVTTSDHFSGSRLGHASIVVDPLSANSLYMATQIFAPNRYGTIDEFTTRIDFAILRVKPEYLGGEDGSYAENLQRVADYVIDNMQGVKYGLTTGIFTKKNSLARSQCAHLVWYAYKHFDDENGGEYNLDLDSNGGMVVVPDEIAMSKYVEPVQIFGFNPAKFGLTQ